MEKCLEIGNPLQNKSMVEEILSLDNETNEIIINLVKDKYGNSMSKSICLGTAPSPSLKNYFGYSRQTGNIAGRCAEPHAAHNLAGKLSKKGFVLKLNDIVFSLAINVSTSSVKPYCATCKIVFPQLR